MYDCFRDDRRRFDVTLLVAVAAALGVTNDALAAWADRCTAVRSAVDAANVVHVSTALPTPPTHFVGRRTELEELTTTVEPRRFVITGLGGSGKTTLATVAARLLVDTGRASGVLQHDPAAAIGPATAAAELTGANNLDLMAAAARAHQSAALCELERHADAERAAREAGVLMGRLGDPSWHPGPPEAAEAARARRALGEH